MTKNMKTWMELAKSVFQVHGALTNVTVVFRKKFSGPQFLRFMAEYDPAFRLELHQCYESGDEEVKSRRIACAKCWDRSGAGKPALASSGKNSVIIFGHVPWIPIPAIGSLQTAQKRSDRRPHPISKSILQKLLAFLVAIGTQTGRTQDRFSKGIRNHV